jgi:hypothetical protein
MGRALRANVGNIKPRAGPGQDENLLAWSKPCSHQWGRSPALNPSGHASSLDRTGPIPSHLEPGSREHNRDLDHPHPQAAKAESSLPHPAPARLPCLPARAPEGRRGSSMADVGLMGTFVGGFEQTSHAVIEHGNTVASILFPLCAAELWARAGVRRSFLVIRPGRIHQAWRPSHQRLVRENAS